MRLRWEKRQCEEALPISCEEHPQVLSDHLESQVRAPQPQDAETSLVSEGASTSCETQAADLLEQTTQEPNGEVLRAQPPHISLQEEDGLGRRHI